MKMGATNFETTSEGKTAAEAFRAARDHALYEYGHRGYTGTIAEKHEFVVIGPALPVEDAQDKAQRLMDGDDDRISDKWGPAGCIQIKGTNTYLFFGWASE